MTAAAGLLAAATLVCAAVTLPGSFELGLLTLAGLLPARRRRRSPLLSPFRLTVIIPAHNEEMNIERCIASVLAADQDRVDLALVVIADNCTDNTAGKARDAGALVLERWHRNELGKGYALDFAFKSLLGAGSQGFAVVDADSEVAANFLTETSALLRAGCDAVQCRYCLRRMDGSIRSRLARLASGGFNILRPRGRDRMGFSAGLYGNGFALSADTVRRIPYAASSIVEDLEYHLTLVKAGRRVAFAHRTAVYAGIPAANSAAVRTQRARWEGGRLRMLATHAAGLLAEVLKGRLHLLEPLLDLLLLPLAFHVALLAAALFSPAMPVREVAIAGLSLVLLYVLATIRVAGAGFGDLMALAGAPFYIGWKLLLLPRLLRGARTGAAWVRTDRVQAD